MNEKYVAMDVHKASVAIGVRDVEGRYIMESIVETKAITLPIRQRIERNHPSDV